MSAVQPRRWRVRGAGFETLDAERLYRVEPTASTILMLCRRQNGHPQVTGRVNVFLIAALVLVLPKGVYGHGSFRFGQIGSEQQDPDGGTHGFGIRGGGQG